MKYNKLVRDNIPEIIRKTGKLPVTYVASKEKYFGQLKKKLKEEVNEFVNSDDNEELADILEVIRAICDYKNISLEELEKVRQKKFKECGGFTKKIILDEVKDTNDS